MDTQRSRRGGCLPALITKGVDQFCLVNMARFWKALRPLGHYFRRMRAKLGAPKAITAAAHKLARIIFHMLTTKQDYHETIAAQNEIQNRQRLEARLHKQAQELG
jgi:hypothetical protein